ncbi:low affinity immunoglobulin epsilon Fc receptor-like [Mercenaria mercenaria]|uniref:low affinity immunoglobulin epsilon Fc receptor-like n=1 Tax=Mercenaria mercenaria TaxID=6596 RepID=UPI00234EC775|nr:low affinity immunoglobulin epsilon Fc receptor-like [Mercenaria mercenaria]
MLKLLGFGILFGIFCLSYSRNLKSRLDFLEKESLKTRSDVMELRDLIYVINATGPVGGSETMNTSVVEAKLKSLDEKLEHFMQEQHDTKVALAMAITEEKAVTRKMLKIIQDLADSNTESVLEIEQTVNENEHERENFKRDWKLFEDSVRSDLNEMRKNTKTLQDMLENVDGNVVIQSAGKIDPCPKNWFREGDTCYLYQKNEQLSWYGARIRCDDLGGKLAEPDTEEKMMYMLLTLDENNVWIGATDDGHEGSWVWASSQKSVGSTSLWQPGQPNNLSGNQHCMEVGLSLLNDESCLEDNYYICEKAVVG